MVLKDSVTSSSWTRAKHFTHLHDKGPVLLPVLHSGCQGAVPTQDPLGFVLCHRTCRVGLWSLQSEVEAQKSMMQMGYGLRV